MTFTAREKIAHQSGFGKNPEESRLQKLSTSKALHDLKVQNAISLMPDGVAISIVQWAGPGEQVVSLPWTMLHSGRDVERVADRVERLRDPFDEWTGTAVGDSLKFVKAYLDEADPVCARTVVDISGDGHSNIGIPSAPEADRLIYDGVTINALVLPEKFNFGTHDAFMFYVHEVARGHGNFVVDVSSYEDYWRALRKKLLRELTPYFVQSNICARDGSLLRPC